MSLLFRPGISISRPTILDSWEHSPIGFSVKLALGSDNMKMPLGNDASQNPQPLCSEFCLGWFELGCFCLNEILPLHGALV